MRQLHLINFCHLFALQTQINQAAEHKAGCDSLSDTTGCYRWAPLLCNTASLCQAPPTSFASWPWTCTARVLTASPPSCTRCHRPARGSQTAPWSDRTSPPRTPSATRRSCCAGLWVHTDTRHPEDRWRFCYRLICYLVYKNVQKQSHAHHISPRAPKDVFRLLPEPANLLEFFELNAIDLQVCPPKSYYYVLFNFHQPWRINSGWWSGFSPLLHLRSSCRWVLGHLETQSGL